jgi:hypothetical protein
VVGGIISLVIGIVLSPLSLLGLIVLIGALGFTPLFSSIVFLRNALRAFQAAKPFLEKGVLIRAFALTAIFSVVVPSVINLEIRQMLKNIENGDAQTARANAQILQYFSPIVNFDSFVLQYRRSGDPKDDPKMEIIAEEYEKLTGEKMEDKVNGIFD